MPSHHKPKRNLALTMDNLKDYPTPPTPESIKEHADWVAQRTIHIVEGTQQQRLTINPQRYHYKHGTLTRKTYYISDPAYTTLQRLARQHEYGHDKGEHQRALSQFIRTLAAPQITWEDTRPQEYKDADYIRLTLKTRKGKPTPLPPLWLVQDEQDRRRNRSLYLNSTTEQVLYKLALSHMIFNHNRPDKLQTTPVISYLLEVIGHNYLTPQNVPINPKPTTGTWRKPAHKLYDERRFNTATKMGKREARLAQAQQIAKEQEC